MSESRIKELYLDFNNAKGRLIEALAEDPSKGGIVVDGTIQRFEFTYELAWKLAKAALSHYGVDAPTPRMVIKEAFKANIIEDGDGWIDMLEDRNRTSHLYDEKQALTIYEKIKNKYAKLLNVLDQKISNTFPELLK